MDFEDLRIYPDRPVAAVGAVVLDGDRVLLVKRGHAPLEGEWSLPGGAVHVGETLEHAIAREILEETCLEVEVGPVVDVLNRISHDAEGRVEYHYVLIDYLCRPTGGTLRRASDAVAAEWAGLDDLDRYGVAGLARAVIRKAASLPWPPRQVHGHAK